MKIIVMYLVPVPAISGAALGPVVERRFLALHTTLKHDPVAVLITVKFTKRSGGGKVFEEKRRELPAHGSCCEVGSLVQGGAPSARSS